MKRNKVLIAITIGLLLFGIVPMVQAKTTILPIERWWEDNWWWYESNPHMGG